LSEAPLFVQSFDLAAWLATNVPAESEVARALHRDALALLDHVVLALKGVDREHHLERADELAALLRVRTRLAQRVGLLGERQLLFLAQELDGIGRQIGGWMRRLAGDSGEARHR
jgi:hypothetical protein